MRIRRTSQPAVPPSTGTKSGIRPKAGNVTARRGALTAKRMPVEPGRPQPKAGNTRGSRTALALKDLLLGRADGFQGNRGLGNTRPRPDALKPQGLRGDTDGFVRQGADKGALHEKAGNTRGSRSSLRLKDLLVATDQVGEAGSARARRPNTLRREDGADGFNEHVARRRQPGPVEVTPRVLEPSVEPSVEPSGREPTSGEPLTAAGPATLGDGFGPGVPDAVDTPRRRPRSGNVRATRGGIGR